MTAQWWQGNTDVPRGYFTCDMCEVVREEWMTRCRACGELFCQQCDSCVAWQRAAWRQGGTTTNWLIVLLWSALVAYVVLP